MKILQITTFDQYGAGIAAKRLHKGLLKEGIDSNILFKFNSEKNFTNTFEYVLDPVTLLDKFFLKLGLKKSIEEKNKAFLNSKPQGYEMYSFPQSSIDLSDHPLVKEADIIHLHWVSLFLDFPSFFSNINKPIVWTLHDMNPFSGGFHYNEDESRFGQYFQNIEKKIKEIKKKAYANSEKLNIVYLSKWMEKCGKESDLFKSLPSTLIPNGIDTQIFKPYNQDFARSVFNIPKDKLVFLFVSEKIDSYRKGFDILVDAIEPFKDDPNVAFYAIGDSKNADLNSKINFLGQIKEERLMALAYSSADVFLLPSRQDNLPNVMLESLGCGTPIISFSEGGMVDVIENGINGLLCDAVTVASFQKAIEKVIQKKVQFNREQISEKCHNYYSLSNQAEKFKSLYQSLLN